MKLKVWFMELRPQFLLLSIVLAFLGTCVAFHEGFFNLIYFLLALIGLLLLHISVNVLNDYFDYKSGIDLEVRRTPFSGGSGILPSQLLSPTSVYRLGLVCLALGTIIGVYFIISVGVLLLPILLLALVLTYFYTICFAKWMVGEFCAGLGMGALPVLGAFFVQTGYYSITATVASISPFILVFNLLFLNEFPDVEVDKKHDRRNLAIWLGRRNASKLYGVFTVIMYGWIVLGVALSWMPPPVLLSLLTLPWGYKAIQASIRHYGDERIVEAMAANVIVVLLTQALMGVGFLTASFI